MEEQGMRRSWGGNRKQLSEENGGMAEIRRNRLRQFRKLALYIQVLN